MCIKARIECGTHCHGSKKCENKPDGSENGKSIVEEYSFSSCSCQKDAADQNNACITESEFNCTFVCYPQHPRTNYSKEKSQMIDLSTVPTMVAM